MSTGVSAASGRVKPSRLSSLDFLSPALLGFPALCPARLSFSFHFFQPFNTGPQLLLGCLTFTPLKPSSHVTLSLPRLMATNSLPLALDLHVQLTLYRPGHGNNRPTGTPKPICQYSFPIHQHTCSSPILLEKALQWLGVILNLEFSLSYTTSI